jgi:hypothetical protein
MATKAELIASLKKEYPTLRVGNDEDGYTNLSDDDYNSTINQWADSIIEAENQKIALENYAANLATAKQSVLNRLGITEEEAAALLT